MSMTTTTRNDRSDTQYVWTVMAAYNDEINVYAFKGENDALKWAIELCSEELATDPFAPVSTGAPTSFTSTSPITMVRAEFEAFRVKVKLEQGVIVDVERQALR